MLVLGITGGHDANWCLVRDGVLLGAFEKERFSRKRHDTGDVVALIPPTLERLGLSTRDIDLIATSEPVWRQTGPGLRRISGRTYRTPSAWEHQLVEVFDRILPCVSVPHHLAHAAYARYTGTADETAVITWDGGGDFYTEDAYTSTSISLWRGGRLEWLERVPNADFGSLWFTYSQAVFGDPQQAGKLMGLAAYGSGALDDAVAERFAVRRRETFDNMFAIKNCWPDFEDPPFVDQELTWESQRAKDLAAAVQHLTVRAGLSVAKAARKVTGATHLALAGGVALNGYLNTEIRRSGLFRSVWVPPAVDDGGLSVGCALFAWHHVLGGAFQPDPAFDWAKVGMWYDSDAVTTALSEVDGIDHRPVELTEAIAHAAGEIAADRPLAWVCGRAEHGPRALGSRSIISPASSDEHRQVLNEKIKFREPFRPVAPFTSDRHVNDYFELDGTSPYMMHIVPCTDRAKREIPAAVHVDGTARVQTLPDTDPLASLVDAVAALGHPPVLINTSFNIREPIVNSPREAVSTFLRSPLRSMYLYGHLVTRADGR
jgi:carbamoyltransferase